MESRVNISSATEPTSKRILIACIGNIFLGDDGFGVEVARRLFSRQNSGYPDSVQIMDVGIRGIDLAYTLLDDFDTLILVDAIQRGGQPGTIYLIEPDLTAMTPEKGGEASRIALDNHSMDPVKVLAYARTLGARPIHTLLVGCEPEPATLGGADPYEDMQMGLSDAVQAGVVEAVKMIDSLVEDLLSTHC